MLQCCVLERKEELVPMIIQDIAKKKCNVVIMGTWQNIMQFQLNCFLCCTYTVDEWLGKHVQTALQSNDMATGPTIKYMNTLFAFYLPKSSAFTVEPM